ncbi:tubulin polymerization-promoting protein homolog [Macrobrachium nipponense]|uniref:tubulin polymerization-promoting protein homolog n=1 Tax=Macrobrachium nipponense TaxID=159736 RepID=UPI0030C831B7
MMTHMRARVVLENYYKVKFISRTASLNNLSSTQDGADDEVEVKRPPFNGMEEKRYRAIMDEIQALMDEVQRQRDEFRNELRVLATCLDNNRQHQASDSTNEDELVDALGEGEEQMSAAQETSAEVKEKKPEDEAQAEKQQEDEKELKEEESKEDDGKDEGGSRTPSTSATPEPRGQENGDDAPGTPKQLTLREQFRNFSKFGDIKSDGKLLTLSQSDKWFKQAKVIDGKSLTTTDTAITFNKLKSKKITFVEFEKYLDEISKSKKMDVKDLKTKLRDCGAPGTSGTTSVVKSSAIDRLTDTKKFTGSHKLRFDSTGRGRGIAGRRDVNDGSGYVTGYKNKNTYDKTH